MIEQKEAIMNTGFRLSLIFSVLFMLVACGNRYSPELYDAEHVGAVYKVVSGKVLGTRDVFISPSMHQKQLFHDRQQAAFLANQRAAQTTNRDHKVHLSTLEPTSRSGTEYIVKTNDGSMYALVEAGKADFDSGDEVFIIFGAAARLIPAISGARF